jgi:hypothetical protein
MNEYFRLPGFTAETIGQKRSMFRAISPSTPEGADRVVPQVVCEQPLQMGSLCCEQWGGDWVCYRVGEKHTQF